MIHMGTLPLKLRLQSPGTSSSFIKFIWLSYFDIGKFSLASQYATLRAFTIARSCALCVFFTATFISDFNFALSPELLCRPFLHVYSLTKFWMFHNRLWTHCFLAHLSQRLKWPIVIAHRPSSLSPSVRRRRRPSVNFHIFNFFSITAWWILMTLGRDEVLMVPYKCCCFSARSAQGQIQGGVKIGHGGSPSLRNFFFRPEGYSDKPNA